MKLHKYLLLGLLSTVFGNQLNAAYTFTSLKDYGLSYDFVGQDVGGYQSLMGLNGVNYNYIPETQREVYSGNFNIGQRVAAWDTYSDTIKTPVQYVGILPYLWMQGSVPNGVYGTKGVVPTGPTPNNGSWPPGPGGAIFRFQANAGETSYTYIAPSPVGPIGTKTIGTCQFTTPSGTQYTFTLRRDANPAYYLIYTMSTDMPNGTVLPVGTVVKFQMQPAPSVFDPWGMGFGFYNSFIVAPPPPAPTLTSSIR